MPPVPTTDPPPGPDPVVPPPLPARLTGDLARLTTHTDLLTDLLDGFGSPLNLVLPPRVGHTARAFRAVLSVHGVRSRLFLAHKANRSAALVRQAAADGLDLDVASHGELCSGLTNGFPGSRMEATGPKNAAFLRLAVQHGLLVHVDNLAELDQVATVQAALSPSRPVEVVLRVAVPGAGTGAGPSPVAGSDTKFGIPAELIPQAFGRIAGHPGAVRLRGLAFHLTSGGLRERVAAFDLLIDLHIAALREGLAPTAVNIGGAFGVRYLAEAADWSDYTSALKRGLLGQGPALTWNGEGFGMEVQDGRVTGTARLPDFALRDDGPTQLGDFLGATMSRHGRRQIAAFLVENDLELHLEPGRALLDQAGLTLARVDFVKTTPAGTRLVGLDANRSSLDATDREFFPDPLLLPRSTGAPQAPGPPGPDRPPPAPDRPPPAPDGPVGAYFGGNLCHPADLVTRHLTRLDRAPAPGDAVAFVNTAGYAMDFTESATLLQRTAAKVAVAHRGGRWRWWRDEDYPPVPAPDPIGGNPP